MFVLTVALKAPPSSIAASASSTASPPNIPNLSFLIPADLNDSYTPNTPASLIPTTTFKSLLDCTHASPTSTPSGVYPAFAVTSTFAFGASSFNASRIPSSLVTRNG